METPMDRARELVDDIVFGLGAGAPYVLAQDARRIAAIAAAGLALRDACREAQNAGGTDYDFHRRMLDARDSYDADIVKAMAEGGE